MEEPEHGALQNKLFLEDNKRVSPIQVFDVFAALLLLPWAVTVFLFADTSSQFARLTAVPHWASALASLTKIDSQP